MSSHFSSRDFSRKINSALGKKGIRIIGCQAVPDETGSFASGLVAYALDDNGTHRLRTYREVEALAGLNGRSN